METPRLRSKVRLVAVACALIVLAPSTLRAAGTGSAPAKACPVPAGLGSRQHDRLRSWHGELEGERRSLASQIRVQRERCRRVPKTRTARVTRCREERSQLETEWLEYRGKRRAYEAALCAAIGSHLRRMREGPAELSRRIEETRRRLAEYADDATRMEATLAEWAEIGAEARREAIAAARDAVVSLALQYLALKKESAITLTREQRSSVAKLLHAYGPILRYAKKFSAERLAELETDAAIVAALGEVKDAMDLSETVFFSPEDREELLAGIAKILGVFVRDPRLGLLLTDAGIASAALYGWGKWYFAREAVNQLVALSEARLEAVARLSELYREDVEHRELIGRSPDATGQLAPLREAVTACGCEEPR